MARLVHITTNGKHAVFINVLLKKAVLMNIYTKKFSTIDVLPLKYIRAMKGEDNDHFNNRYYACACLIAKTLGGVEALHNGGYLQKRLQIAWDWRICAIASTFIPYIMEDANNCPVIAHELMMASVRGLLDFKSTLNPEDNMESRIARIRKDHAWLGGMKVPFAAIFNKPKDLGYNPQSNKDFRMAEVVMRCQNASPNNKILRKVVELRSTYKYKDIKEMCWLLPDAFVVAKDLKDNELPVVGLQGYTFQDIRNWHDANVEVRTAMQHKISDARNAALRSRILPGEDYCPHLDQYHMKTGGELIDAGRSLHHCIGSYANRDGLVHYRKDDVCAQVDEVSGKIIQCYDIYDQVTEASKAFEELISFAIHDWRKIHPYVMTEIQQAVREVTLENAFVDNDVHVNNMALMI